MLEALKMAGPVALLTIVAGVLTTLLALVAALIARGSSSARVLTVLALLGVLVTLGLGFGGHQFAMLGVERSLDNVPWAQRDALLLQGTVEARMNLLFGLGSATLALALAGFVAVRTRARGGVVLAVLALGAWVLMFGAWVRPIPEARPLVPLVPGGLKVPTSAAQQSPLFRPLVALTPAGLFVDGDKALTMDDVLAHTKVLDQRADVLPLVVDVATPVPSLLDALEAAARRGVHTFDLVATNHGKVVAVMVHDSSFKPVDEQEPALRLVLASSAKELRLFTTQGELDPLEHTWSLATTKLREVRNAFPRERVLRFAPGADTSIQDLFDGLDAARGPDEGDPLMQEFLLGRADVEARTFR